jgi:tellurite resistance-related uncharacterized protein
MKTLPASVRAYRRTPEFTEDTIPAGLRRDHTTKTGVWGRICVLEGALVYHILEPEPEDVLLDADCDGVVEPEVPHFVEAAGRVRFYVEFLREPRGES